MKIIHVEIVNLRSFLLSVFDSDRLLFTELVRISELLLRFVTKKAEVYKSLIPLIIVIEQKRCLFINILSIRQYISFIVIHVY